jgi:uncharacterized protein YndB with AHSA1/START domain
VTSASEAAIRSSVVVPRSIDAAFQLYTDGIATWWPLRTHSIAEEGAATCVFEARVGGRIYERTTAGEEHAWGTVIVCEPPSRLVHTWHPGRSDATAQEVEVRFTTDGRGTRVDVVHTGWERYGERLAQAIESYENGWEYVLRECFVAAASR